MKTRLINLDATLRLVRRALRETFPRHTIDASPTPTGLCGIHVTWCDGPTVEQVRRVLEPFSLGWHNEVHWHSMKGAPVKFQPFVRPYRTTSGQPVDQVAPQTSATLASISTFKECSTWTAHLRELDAMRRSKRLLRRLEGQSAFAAT
ncbi:hypothetical protein [Paraburkholderia sp. BL21I4N1]|uniref:hypothetical protein n=1 Tax=Paraburkholderia sp. BL21I4N1 TaxID=1938801 RepID=UPI000CFCCA7E|nr:hypothetical protein [Paraburkholderia sp. BL21I4N1]PQV53353.1 hypothetical protein B0G83_102439 [Paraburkholderia sp. BL21I4N1]